MKIAFLLTQFPALSETFILSQVNCLLDRGHEVHLLVISDGTMGPSHPSTTRHDLASRTISPKTPARLAPRTISAGLLILTELLRKRWPLLGALNVVEYGRDALSLHLLHQVCAFNEADDYDVIHCHFGENGLRALRFRELGALKGQLVTTFYGYDVSSYVTKHGAEAYRSLFAKSDLVIGISKRMCRQLEVYGCPPNRVMHLPIGVDLRFWRFRATVRHADEPIRILSVGRLVEKKGFETAIRAVATVAKKHPEIRFEIVGDGPLKIRLQNLVDSLKLGSSVRLLGPMTEEAVRAKLESSHLFLLASQTAPDGDQEGLPQVILEAQAVGLPVISTRHSAIPEAVQDGKSAFLVEPGDSNAMAERLEFLIEHPELWHSMGSAGRAMVESQFDLERSIDQLLGAYQKLLC